jgi:HEPN domain-containing protein
MPRRTKDWLRQAERDLEHSKADLKGRYYEWVCFSAQQAAEKALKATIFRQDIQMDSIPVHR